MHPSFGGKNINIIGNEHIKEIKELKIDAVLNYIRDY